MKLSGRTSDGWSVVVLEAVTAQETADASRGADISDPVVVEPRANYSVVRVVRDLRQGRSAVGVIGTGVARQGAAADQLGLPSSALAGGIDFRHRFGDDRYQVWGWALASRVRGSAEAVMRVQTSPVHLFQRPDADHLILDGERTSLAGTATLLRLHRVAGGPWRGGVGLQTRSPGFDVGDAGFQRLSDARILYAELGYERFDVQGPFRSWEVYTTHRGAHTTGGERAEIGGGTSVESSCSAACGEGGGVWNTTSRASRPGCSGEVRGSGGSTKFWDGAAYSPTQGAA